MQPATDSDLQAYLDAYGIDGAPTAAGWYVVHGRNAGLRVWEVVEWGAHSGSHNYVPGENIDDIVRHAPLRLAARKRGKRHAALAQSRYTEPNLDSGDLFTLQEFLEMVESGALIDYDGAGSLADEMRHDPQSVVCPSTVDDIPEGTTHILWFNR